MYAEKIRMAASPKLARKLGQSRKLIILNDWESLRDEVMIRGIRAKFENIELRRVLVNTGYKLLIEASPYDYYWGCGADGSGQNKLGKLLMSLRSAFIKSV